MGETQHAMKTIRQGADYLSACLVSDSEYVVQVGNYAYDLADTSSPEDMTQARPVYTVNATSPGRLMLLCLRRSTAAAFIASSVTHFICDLCWERVRENTLLERNLTSTSS